MGINTIPQELLLLIAENLPTKDLCGIRCTCHGLSHLLTPLFHKICLRDRGKLTALQWAAKHGHESLAELAILEGADVNQTTRSRERYTALHLAARSRKPNCNIIRTLVKHGARIDARDSYNTTPLLEAVSSRKGQALEAMLSMGASSVSNDELGKLAHSAARNGDVRCLRALGVAGADYSSVDLGQPILHSALYFHGKGEVVEYILGQEGGRKVVNATDQYGATALHRLMSSKYLERRSGRRILELLLECGADIWAKNSDGNMPAHILAISEDVGLMAELMRVSFDINTKGREGNTVLHVAIRGTGVMMKYLLELAAGQSILNAQNSKGRTPLHLAVSHGIREAVELLLKHGADIGVKDNDGKTPPQIALSRRQFDIVRTFKDAGVDIKFEDIPR